MNSGCCSCRCKCVSSTGGAVVATTFVSVCLEELYCSKIVLIPVIAVVTDVLAWLAKSPVASSMDCKFLSIVVVSNWGSSLVFFLGELKLDDPPPPPPPPPPPEVCFRFGDADVCSAIV